jgi:putative phosphoesterase
MLIGIFADTHDHLANIRLAVERFNAAEVDLVLFAGDLVSTFAVPPLRKLKAPIVACFGDNEGNKVGLLSGFGLVGKLAEPPVFVTTDDGVRFVITHMKRQLRGLTEPYDVAVFGHTHKPRIETDEQGRLLINPGETSGWTFGRPTLVFYNTVTKEAEIVDLIPPDPETAKRATEATTSE